MRILFVHQNYPAQFKHLALHLARGPANEVAALTISGNAAHDGVKVVRCKLTRGTSGETHPWASDFEAKVIRGEAFARGARQLRDSGFRPDVVYCHPGWGEALFLKDVFPRSRLVCYAEFYYRSAGLDVGFDGEFSPTSEDDACRMRARNAHTLISLEACDLAIAPTEWQRSTFPAEFRHKIEVVHDGIDTDAIRPQAGVRLRIREGGVKLSQDDEVVTFVNRNLEPYRGFPTFMRALPELQRLRPAAQVVIIGGDGVGYGAARKDGRSYKQAMLEELAGQLDAGRIHFVGQVAHAAFIRLLQLSSAHVYLTYPFVLSWSVLEAMAVEAPLIASSTPPVCEVVQSDVNGKLVDFFDAQGLAHAIADALEHRADWVDLRRRARETVVSRYDLKRVCLPRQLALLGA